MGETEEGSRGPQDTGVLGWAKIHWLLSSLFFLSLLMSGQMPCKTTQAPSSRTGSRTGRRGIIWQRRTGTLQNSHTRCLSLSLWPSGFGMAERRVSWFPRASVTKDPTRCQQGRAASQALREDPVCLSQPLAASGVCDSVTALCLHASHGCLRVCVSSHGLLFLVRTCAISLLMKSAVPLGLGLQHIFRGVGRRHNSIHHSKSLRFLSPLMLSPLSQAFLGVSFSYLHPPPQLWHRDRSRLSDPPLSGARWSTSKHGGLEGASPRISITLRLLA